MTSVTQKKDSTAPSSPLFHLRGGSFTLLVLRLDDAKDPVLFQALRDKVMQAPNFFSNAPVVIDLQNLRDAAPFNLAELGRRLRQHQLIPIGVQHGTEEQNRAAINTGWCVFPDGRHAPLPEMQPGSATPPAAVRNPDPNDVQPDNEACTSPVTLMSPASSAARPADEPATDAAATMDAEAIAGSPARLLTRPVRSGRKVYAQGGDLVVMASISAGAELLADGHIHAYGALRGRALAGVSGDTSARIFCQSLEAELVSIAGFWRVREDIPEDMIGKPVQVFLDGDRIAIEPLA